MENKPSIAHRNPEYYRAFIAAIQSLDTLNDQIVQFIFTPKSCEFDVDADTCDDPNTAGKWLQQREAVKSSMALMRRLLVDAQAKFRKMMDENKALASRIDGDLQTAQQEVSILRAELADTNKRINQISSSVVLAASTTTNTDVTTSMAGNVLTTCVPPPTATSAVGSGGSDDPGAKNLSHIVSPHVSSNGNNNNNALKVGSGETRGGGHQNNSKLSAISSKDRTSQPSASDHQNIAASCSRCRNCTHEDANQVEERLSQLQEQNEKLSQQNRSLLREVEELRAYKERTQAQDKEVQPQVQKLESELEHAKEALQALRQDRKRLKAEKFDLLNQMKQLYGTLEDKEKELRDFIRTYEQKMKDSDDSIKQLVRDREESEREKWNILKHARDEADRSVALCAQLGLKEAQIKQLQEELSMVRDKMMGYYSDTEGRHCRSNGYRSPSAASSHTINGRDSSNTPTPNPPGSDPTTSSSHAGTPTVMVDSDASPLHHSSSRDSQRPSLPGLSRSAEEIYSNGSTDGGSIKKGRRRKESKGTWGSISRVFTRSKQRKALEPGTFEDQRSSWSPQSSLCASPLTEDSYAEKVRLLEEAQGTPMERWKAATVLAWLEITLGMPHYGSLCAENIKSGKILLELSDTELETGLGITNAMHRRKLRLAIEEHREASVCPYPKICLLTHTWVVDEWLPSLGLSCYIESFATHLVDGRVLDTLTKKDLEKYLGITRKFHQVSIMHAIQLLRMVKFDRQLLAQRRSHSENMDVDPLVWTNQRFIKWAKSIDLGEYANNLKESGVHGALVVLEPSFTADTMATALGIPASKNIIRRHLTTELETLIQPSRMSLEAEALVNSKRNEKTIGSSASPATGSLGRNFQRSYSRGALERPADKRRTSMRFATWKRSQGSLTRALGLKIRNEVQQPPLLPQAATPPPVPRPGNKPKTPQTHRRNRSYGNIETLTVTPV